jgi:NAD(P) transhydrogenase subunit alpha
MGNGEWGNGEWVIYFSHLRVPNSQLPILNYQLPITNSQFAFRSFSLMTEALIAALFVFVLASFTGFEIINKIPPTLHTPLMSGSNAISGIAVLGAIVASGARETNLSVILGLIAVVLAMVNVVGGFLVTDRMLQMFKKKANG